MALGRVAIAAAVALVAAVAGGARVAYVLRGGLADTGATGLDGWLLGLVGLDVAAAVATALVASFVVAAGVTLVLHVRAQQQQQQQQQRAPRESRAAGSVTTTITSSRLVDAQLNVFLNNVFAEFVDNWYPTITNDSELRSTLRRLVEELVRKIEARVLRVDLIDFMFYDALFVLCRHLDCYRQSRAFAGSSYAGDLDVDAVFAHLQPHFALTSPEHEQLYIKHVAEWLLQLVVPEEEHHNEVLRVALRELLGNVLLLPIIDKISEPDFVTKSLITVFAPIGDMERYLAVSPAAAGGSAVQGRAGATGGTGSADAADVARGGRTRSHTRHSAASSDAAGAGGAGAASGKSRRPRVPKIFKRAMDKLKAGGPRASPPVVSSQSSMPASSSTSSIGQSSSTVLNQLRQMAGMAPHVLAAHPTGTLPDERMWTTAPAADGGAAGKKHVSATVSRSASAAGGTPVPAAAGASAERDTTSHGLNNILPSLRPITSKMTSLFNPSNLIKPLVGRSASHSVYGATASAGGAGPGVSLSAATNMTENGFFKESTAIAMPVPAAPAAQAATRSRNPFDEDAWLSEDAASTPPSVAAAAAAVLSDASAVEVRDRASTSNSGRSRGDGLATSELAVPSRSEDNVCVQQAAPLPPLPPLPPVEGVVGLPDEGAPMSSEGEHGLSDTDVDADADVDLSDESDSEQEPLSPDGSVPGAIESPPQDAAALPPSTAAPQPPSAQPVAQTAQLPSESVPPAPAESPERVASPSALDLDATVVAAALPVVRLLPEAAPQPAQALSWIDSLGSSVSELVSGLRAVVRFVRDLRATEDFGPFTAALDRDEHLDEPLYHLFDHVFAASTSPNAWIFAGFNLFLKPLLRWLLGRDLMNRLLLFLLQWVVSEARLAYYVQTLTESLWVDGKWTDADPVLTPSQAAERRLALRSLLDELMEPLTFVLGAWATHDGAQTLVDVVQSKARNKRVIFIALDLALAAVFPEMARDKPVDPHGLPYLNTLARVDAVGAVFAADNSAATASATGGSSSGSNR